LSGTGIGADAGPQTPCPRRCGEKHQELVREGSQDQSNLPHSEPIQPGRDAEVFDRGMLGPGARYGDDPTGFAARNGTQRQLSAANLEPDGHSGRPAHLQPHQQVHQGVPGAHRLVRCGELPGSQSDALYYYHIPFLVCRDVRRPWPWLHHVPLRTVDGVEGEAPSRQKVR